MTKIQVNALGKPYLTTGGKALVYPESTGGSFIAITTNKKLATLTCGEQTYTLTGDELSHAFPVTAGTYICTVSLSGFDTVTDTVIVTTNNIYNKTINLGRLPSQYQEVEYIQATGSQWILTDTIFDDDVEFKLDMLRAGSVVGSLCGYRHVASASTSGNMRYFFVYADGTVGCRLGTSAVNIGRCPVNTKFTIEYKANNIFIDGVPVGSAGSKYATSDYGKFGILYPNAVGYYTADLSGFTGNLYGCDLIKNNALVFQGIPCRKVDNSDVGLYDVVSETFLTNAGTGSFVAGPDVN